MNRRRAERWISRAMDGELSPRQRMRLERVLEADPDLSELRREWSAYRGLMRDAIRRPVQTSEAAWQDVRRAIRLEDDREPAEEMEAGFGWRVKWTSAFTVAILFLLGAVFFFQFRAWHGTDLVARADRTIVEWVESDLPDAMSMVYEDADTGLTVIWILTSENGEEDRHAG